MGRRRKWQEAGDRLKNITNSTEAAHLLTEEELDWVRLLRDRFYEIANRALEDDQIEWTRPRDKGREI